LVYIPTGIVLWFVNIENDRMHSAWYMYQVERCFYSDQYFVRRCQRSQKLLPNANALKAPETQGESPHAP
jgi:hypothetical protein